MQVKRGDSLRREGDRVLLDSSVDMPYWEVRAFRKTKIVIEGAGYFVVDKRGRDGRYHYTLQAWDESGADPPGRVIEYDQDFVDVRDAIIRRRTKAQIVQGLLLAFYPVLGFVWSPTKQRLEDAFGIDARLTTRWSMMTVYGLIVVAFAFLVIGIGSGALPVWKLSIVILVLAPDAIGRWDACLRDNQTLGFYEWLLRRDQSRL